MVCAQVTKQEFHSRLLKIADNNAALFEIFVGKFRKLTAAGEEAASSEAVATAELQQCMEEKEQQLMSKHLELKDAQMAIQKLEEHIASIGCAQNASNETTEENNRLVALAAAAADAEKHEAACGNTPVNRVQYRCDKCSQVFDELAAAEKHEAACGTNPVDTNETMSDKSVDEEAANASSPWRRMDSAVAKLANKASSKASKARSKATEWLSGHEHNRTDAVDTADCLSESLSLSSIKAETADTIQPDASLEQQMEILQTEIASLSQKYDASCAMLHSAGLKEQLQADDPSGPLCGMYKCCAQVAMTNEVDSTEIYKILQPEQYVEVLKWVERSTRWRGHTSTGEYPMLPHTLCVYWYVDLSL